MKKMKLIFTICLKEIVNLTIRYIDIFLEKKKLEREDKNYGVNNKSCVSKGITK